MGLNSIFAERLICSENQNTLEHDYCAFHANRFRYVIELCRTLKPHRDCSVLDVGRSQLSFELADYYKRVVTIGFPISNFAHESVASNGSGVQPAGHIVFDLNKSGHDEIPVREEFDLIVFAETIEHLYSAPELTLHALGRLLNTDGFLVCQTPNAVSLERRYHMLRGRNPFERIRCNPLNPGHFREYTIAELIELGSVAGLRTIRYELVDYFPHAGRLQGLRSALRRVFPSLRSGQTIVFGRSCSQAAMAEC